MGLTSCGGLKNFSALGSGSALTACTTQAIPVANAARQANSRQPGPWATDGILRALFSGCRVNFMTDSILGFDFTGGDRTHFPEPLGVFIWAVI
jgi:hypothetical protein